jgi:hypothetical protein
MRRPYRPGWRAWLGGLALLAGGYAGYRGLAGLGAVTTTTIVALTGIVVGAVLVMAVLADPGPMRTPALHAGVALAAYFVTLALWPAAGSSAFHTAGAVVAAVLAVGLFVRHREGVRSAEAVVMLLVATGLVLGAAVALHALAVGDATTGAGLVAAGCIGTIGYLVASAVVVEPLAEDAPDIPAQRVADAGPVRSSEPVPPPG